MPAVMWVLIGFVAVLFIDLFVIDIAMVIEYHDKVKKANEQEKLRKKTGKTLEQWHAAISDTENIRKD